MTERSRDPQQPSHPDDSRTGEPASADGTEPVTRWCCPNCGQIVFQSGSHPPPDFCAYCGDLTTWQPVSDE